MCQAQMQRKNISARNKRPNGLSTALTPALSPSDGERETICRSLRCGFLPGCGLNYSPFEHAIAEGRQREARFDSLAGKYIAEALADVHGSRRVAVVEQKIKIGPALRAA